MSSDADCIFCKIIAGDIPSFKVYEDGETFAFMDINPANDGHALVVPREHSKDLHHVSEEALFATMRTAKKLAGAVQRTLQPDGLNLLQCNGPGAAQSVFHFHVHVLPRRMDDGMTMNWELVTGDTDAIKETAERIRQNL